MYDAKFTFIYAIHIFRFLLQLLKGGKKDGINMNTRSSKNGLCMYVFHFALQSYLFDYKINCFTIISMRCLSIEVFRTTIYK